VSEIIGSQRGKELPRNNGTGDTSDEADARSAKANATGGPVSQVPSMRASTAPKKRVAGAWSGARSGLWRCLRVGKRRSSVTWNAVMDSLHCANRERYTALFLLGW